MNYQDIAWNTHKFMLVRPRKRDWSYYDGSTSQRGMEEWRPALIQGVNESQRVYVIGSASGHSLDDFDAKGLDHVRELAQDRT